jgi:hypothetical protein
LQHAIHQVIGYVHAIEAGGRVCCPQGGVWPMPSHRPEQGRAINSSNTATIDFPSIAASILSRLCVSLRILIVVRLLNVAPYSNTLVR